MGALSKDRVIGAVRTSERQWRRWLGAQQFSRLQPATYDSGSTRLVVVAPHPDDELLACGGLLGLHARRGGAVKIVGVTDGEASHPGYSAPAVRGLARERRLERERGLARLGIDERSITRLGLPDGQVSAYLHVLRAALDALLAPCDLVVSTWSLDGHPDHDATGAQVAEACRSRGCRLLAAPVWMWHWSQPGDPRVPWERLHALDLPAEMIERKTAALAEHASQLAPRGDLGPVLDPAIRSRAMRDAEYYFLG